VVSPDVLFAGETATFQLAIDPSAAERGQPMDLRAVNASEQEKVSLTIPLVDSGLPGDGDSQAGDGIYSGRSAELVVPGDYDIRLGTSTPFPVAPATAHVGFELRQSIAVGTINYGGGQLLKTLLGIDEQVSVPGVITLTNRRKEPCEYRVRVLFPLSPEDGRELERRDLASIPTAEGFDPGKHLDTNLVESSPGTPAGRPSRELVGALPLDGTLSIGVVSRLSEDALHHLHGEADGIHPTLATRNGMIVQVQVRWLDEKSSPLSRTLLIPVSIRTSPWYWRGMTAAVVTLILALIGFWLYREARRRVANLRGPAAASSDEPREDRGAGETRGSRWWPFGRGRRRPPGTDEAEEGPTWDSRTDEAHGTDPADDPWTQD
jgi:hypothetical protein